MQKPLTGKGSGALIVGLALLCAASVGVAVGVAFAPPTAPASLEGEHSIASVTVTGLSYDDSRDVVLTLTVGPPRALLAPTSGILSSLSCADGSTMSSGSSSFRIDGEPMLALATSVPLWRDIRPGDTGADVAALQTELTRLGYPTPADGRWGRNSLAAYSALAKAAGVPAAPDGVIHTDAIAWLPAASVITSQCTASVGTRVIAGDQIATFPAKLTSARIAESDLVLAPGGRSLLIDDQRFDAPADGVVTDVTVLDAILRSSAYAQSDAANEDGKARTVTYESVLSTPIRLRVVPPSAIYRISGEDACVQSVRRPMKVHIVASQLGETLVTVPSGRTLTSVSLMPDRSRACG